MTSTGLWRSPLPQVLTLAIQALRAWTPRQVVTAAVATAAVGVLIGLATVLIPNPFFARDIPTVPWNYPVWIVTSVLTGMLVATYVRPARESHADDAEPREPRQSAKRVERMGAAGAVLAWFAVGCPVCNKIALLALGYSGALTWFAPAQPYLATVAIVLSGAALVWRLRGQAACPSRRIRTTVMA